jgi:hypothetical protein
MDLIPVLAYAAVVAYLCWLLWHQPPPNQPLVVS